MTLTEFLLARIAEDEAVARDAGNSATWVRDNLPLATPISLVIHAIQWEPTRVLADCESKRRIIVRAQRAEALVGWHPHGQGAASAMRGTLRDLALPYAGHADYREEWRQSSRSREQPANPRPS